MLTLVRKGRGKDKRVRRIKDAHCFNDSALPEGVSLKRDRLLLRYELCICEIYMQLHAIIRCESA